MMIFSTDTSNVDTFKDMYRDDKALHQAIVDYVASNKDTIGEISSLDKNIAITEKKVYIAFYPEDEIREPVPATVAEVNKKLVEAGICNPLWGNGQATKSKKRLFTKKMQALDTTALQILMMSMTFIEPEQNWVYLDRSVILQQDVTNDRLQQAIEDLIREGYLAITPMEDIYFIGPVYYDTAFMFTVNHTRKHFKDNIQLN